MKTIYLLLAFVFLSNDSNSQGKTIIVKAYIADDTLKILFKNTSNKSTVVPILEYRVGKDKQTLYDKYYGYTGDTIFVDLKKEIDKGLYKVNTSHKVQASTGKLYYVDKKLKPRASVWTTVKLNKVNDVKVLVLQFEENKWVYPLNKK